MIKMQRFYFLIFSLLMILSGLTFSQSFDGDWRCVYATNDDAANGTGIQTLTVTAVGENEFVALVSQAAKPWVPDDACYLVGYRNADSSNGRLGNYPYNAGENDGWNDYHQPWVNGFDQVLLDHARGIASRGNLIFVANNDPEANILVFELADSVITHPKRMITSTNPFNPITLWAIDVDDNGRVYVTTEGDSLNASEVLIYESPDVETAWESGFNAEPLQRFSLPDNGDARGIAVSGDGTVLYVSNFISEKVYCYTGDASTGYDLNSSFSFTLTDEPLSSNGNPLDPGPWGLKLIPDKNILSVVCHADFLRGENYQYGRVYFLNPNTGEILDTLDVAKWNFDRTGDWSSRGGGTASGYTSPYYIDFDENYNVYTNSYFGWTVDKWAFSGEIPTIDFTLTSIEKDISQIPTEFMIKQNYPNPFNPSTTIEFSLTENSNVSLFIYSLTGEIIAKIIKETDFSAGVYKFTFDASQLASGTYIYTLSNGKQNISKKMTLIK